MIERRAIVDREQWLEWRKQDVTASRVGALFGCDMPDKNLTVLHLWAEQRGVEFPHKPETKRMKRGRKLEGLVGEEVSELRPEWSIEPVGAYYRDADLRLGATPDFWVFGDPRGRGVLQAKTAATDIIAKHWDAGRVPPDWIEWQVRTEMLLTDAAFGIIAVLDPFNWDCHIVEVERSHQAEAALTTAVAAFWIAVGTGTEPDPDFKRDAEVIKALMPRERPGKSIDFSGHNELPAMLEERAELMNKIKDADDRCDEIESEVKFLMGDAESADGLPDWRITYKVQKRAGYTVPPKEPRVLLIKDKRVQS